MSASLPQHSSKRNNWRTPHSVVSCVKALLGTIDLDAASDEDANDLLQATAFFSKENSGLDKPWTGRNIFVNPPGGILDGKSATKLFWEKAVREYLNSQGEKEILFLAFSMEILQVSQSCEMSAMDFPFCIPRKRLHFWHPEEPNAKAPTHGNAIILLSNDPITILRFKEIFSLLGKVVIPM